jgi:hypothetical protein
MDKEKSHNQSESKGTKHSHTYNYKPILLVGKTCSLLITIMGVAYFFLILGLLITGNFQLPPPELAQNMGAIVDLTIAPLITILIGVLYSLAHQEKKIFALIGLVFSSLFTVVVYINRVTQLTVVNQSIAKGKTDGLHWFLPYEPNSVMFAMEIMGFSFFLSIALLFVAFSFSGISTKKIKLMLITYSILGLISFISFLFNSIVVNIGFVAWGLVLYIATWLLYKYFLKICRTPEPFMC